MKEKDLLQYGVDRQRIGFAELIFFTEWIFFAD